MPGNPDDDIEFMSLLDDLAVAWAKLEIEEDGFELASRFARAAYGQGYTTALTEPLAAV